MTRFLPLPIALGEISRRLGCAPTSDDYDTVQSDFLRNLLIDTETGEMAVDESGSTHRPIEFLEQELLYTLQYRRPSAAIEEAAQ